MNIVRRVAAGAAILIPLALATAAVAWGAPAEPAPKGIGDLEAKALSVLALFKWGALILACIAVVVAAVQIMFSRGHQNEGLGMLGKIAIAVLLITSPIAIVGFISGW